jgi:Cys-rich protein (TIGR01571 family)
MQSGWVTPGSAPGTAEAILMVPEVRARPLFPGGANSPSNNIRGYFEPCCCGMRPGAGPNVPPHWYDGGKGWTTRHFIDIEPFDMAQQNPGIHRCKYCAFEARGKEGCCGKGACWCPIGSAPGEMESHLVGIHGVVPPMKRKWATSCTECDGFLEAWCCWSCQASRQFMAAHGWANQLSIFWCLMFSCGGGHHHNEHGQAHRLVSLHLAAWMTRNAIRELHSIDESCCETALMALCCPICSLAQTYREYSAAGVWPGGVCAGDAPPMYMMDQPPPHLMQGGAGQGQLYPSGGKDGGYQKIM